MTAYKSICYRSRSKLLKAPDVEFTKSIGAYFQEKEAEACGEKHSLESRVFITVIPYNFGTTVHLQLFFYLGIWYAHSPNLISLSLILIAAEKIDRANVFFSVCWVLLTSTLLLMDF